MKGVTMRRLPHICAFLLTAIALVSPLCAADDSPQTTRIRTQTTINPDGSGKITVEAYFPLSKPATADDAKKFAAKVVQGAADMDAWKDVSFDAADGRAHVILTGYATDVASHIEGMGPSVKWTDNKDGTYSLTAISSQKPPGIPQPGMTDAQVAEHIQSVREMYSVLKLTPLPASHFENVYSLPGKITGVNIFTPGPQNSVSYSIEGAKVAAAWEKIVNDDKLLDQLVRGGLDFRNILDEVGDPVLEQVFGKKGPIRATVTGADKPLFDYQSEMKAARDARADLYHKLGLPVQPQ